jgi:hypothetical protein
MALSLASDRQVPQASSGLLTRTPNGLDVIQWLTRRHTVRTERPSAALLHERLWEARQVRRGAQYPNRRNQHGLYYWPRTGEHVWYESGLELASLVDLDHQGEAVHVSAQPFRILFRSPSPVVYHDPDFFAVHTNGDQVVYDVKPASRITPEVAAQFAETARVCAEVGWRHVVLSETHPVRAANLEFLRAGRHARCHPTPDRLEHLRSVFAGGRRFGEGLAMVDRRHPALVMPHVRHLVWHRHLSADLDQHLDFDSVATTTDRSTSCCT